MTREEAIDLLDNLIGMVEDNHNSDYDTALQMGIQALEQERSFIEELEKIKNEIQGLIDFEESCCCNATLGYECLSVINESIEAIRGKNIEKKYETEVITRGNCMMCGKELTEGLFFCKECEEKANSRK